MIRLTIFGSFTISTRNFYIFFSNIACIIKLLTLFSAIDFFYWKFNNVHFITHLHILSILINNQIYKCKLKYKILYKFIKHIIQKLLSPSFYNIKCTLSIKFDEKNNFMLNMCLRFVCSLIVIIIF